MKLSRNTFNLIRRSFMLLDNRARHKFIFLLLSQILISILDIMGALILTSVISYFTFSLIGKHSPPNQIMHFANKISAFSNSNLAIIMAILAISFFLLKSTLGMLLLKRTLNFLGHQHTKLIESSVSNFLARDSQFVYSYSPQNSSYLLLEGTKYLTSELFGPLAITVSELGLLALFAVVLLILNPILTMATLIFFVSGFAWLHRYLGRQARWVGIMSTQSTIQTQRDLQEEIGLYKSIAAAGEEGFYVAKLLEAANLGTSTHAKRRFLEQVPKFVLEVMLILGLCVLGFVGIMTTKHNSSPVVIVLFLTVLIRATPSILRFQNSIFSVKHSLGQAESTLEFLDQIATSNTRKLHTSNNSTEPFTNFNPVTVKFDRVNFHYRDADSIVLQDISFCVDAGTSLAIVGQSGVGKSTLLDLMLGLLVPTQGTISMETQSIGQENKGSSARITYVPQEPRLLSTSLLENIALGLTSDEIDSHRVFELLYNTGLSEFISSLPLKLGTKVGGDGLTLSGGQLQRIAFCRALYPNPGLLLLDEATSALDPENEKLIADILVTLKGKTTVVSIAHRLSTILVSDRILYLQEGNSFILGTFDEVLAESNQFGQYIETLTKHKLIQGGKN